MPKLWGWSRDEGVTFDLISRKEKRSVVRLERWHERRRTLAKDYHRRYEVQAAVDNDLPCPTLLEVREDVDYHFELYTIPMMVKKVT